MRLASCVLSLRLSRRRQPQMLATIGAAKAQFIGLGDRGPGSGHWAVGRGSKELELRAPARAPSHPSPAFLPRHSHAAIVVLPYLLHLQCKFCNDLPSLASLSWHHHPRFLILVLIIVVHWHSHLLSGVLDCQSSLKRSQAVPCMPAFRLPASHAVWPCWRCAAICAGSGVGWVSYGSHSLLLFRFCLCIVGVTTWLLLKG